MVQRLELFNELAAKLTAVQAQYDNALLLIEQLQQSTAPAPSLPQAPSLTRTVHPGVAGGVPTAATAQTAPAAVPAQKQAFPTANSAIAPADKDPQLAAISEAIQPTSEEIIQSLGAKRRKQLAAAIEERQIAAATNALANATPNTTAQEIFTTQYKDLMQSALNIFFAENPRIAAHNTSGTTAMLLTADVAMIMCSSVEMGMSRVRAAAMAGISGRTWKNWAEKARARQEPYVALMDLLEMAEARFEARHVANWSRFAGVDWRAAQTFLARRLRGAWNDVDEVAELPDLTALSDAELAEIVKTRTVNVNATDPNEIILDHDDAIAYAHNQPRTIELNQPGED
jgi:hypothetical protein